MFSGVKNENAYRLESLDIFSTNVCRQSHDNFGKIENHDHQGH